MSRVVHDTLIVGAGIAGLACAHTLSRAGASFAVIAENVGGRIRTSEDGAVNYGAALVSNDYDHVLPFVHKGRRIRMGDLYFYQDGPGYPMISTRLLRYGLQPLKLICELRRFRKAYNRFRHRAERVSQKEAIEADPYLLGLYHRPANELADELGITEFCHSYLCQGLYPLVFASRDDINAFLYLHFLQPLIVPMYSFTFQFDALTAPFADRIRTGTVQAIEPDAGGYRVIATDGEHMARNVVVATPVHVSKRLVGIPRSKDPVDAHVIHVRGELRADFQRGRAHLFHTPSSIYGLLIQEDASVVIYSREANPDLDVYFVAHEVVGRVHWTPAEFTMGHELIEARCADGLYLAGDYNVGGLEATFITGVYAANQVLESTDRAKPILVSQATERQNSKE